MSLVYASNFSMRKGFRVRTVLWLLLVNLTILLLFVPKIHAAQVTLAWDPSSGTDIAGYKLYYGTSSRNYPFTLDVGSVTTHTITGLSDGQTYYIAATAYNTQGNESAFSEEVHITFSGNQAPVAKDRTLTTMQNTHASAMLRASDADRDPLSYRIIDNGSKGSAVVVDPATGSFTYTPDHNSTGKDTFTFAANDGAVDSNVATVRVTINANSSTTYEKAIGTSVAKWTIIDKQPSGAAVTSIYDAKRHSRVIELKGDGLNNSFRLRNADGSNWNNSTQFVLQWSMSYSESFKIFADVQTTAGHRYITYTSTSSDHLGTGKFVSFGIGSGAIMDQWHTFTRDLQADLEKAQPDVTILEVNGLLIRGSLRIDDITLLEHLPFIDTDGDAIGDDDEEYLYGTDPLKADTSGCGISDGYKLDYFGSPWKGDADNDGIINLLDDDSDNDGFLDGYEIAHGSNPRKKDSTPTSP
jgi:hypothetical protein